MSPLSVSSDPVSKSLPRLCHSPLFGFFPSLHEGKQPSLLQVTFKPTTGRSGAQKLFTWSVHCGILRSLHSSLMPGACPRPSREKYPKMLNSKMYKGQQREAQAKGCPPLICYSSFQLLPHNSLYPSSV